MCVVSLDFIWMIKFSFSPKGAYGVPIQYERSFRWKLGQFRYLCQSNALPGHVKITVSRENLFEDSFAQVHKHQVIVH